MALERRTHVSQRRTPADVEDGRILRTGWQTMTDQAKTPLQRIREETDSMVNGIHPQAVQAKINLMVVNEVDAMDKRLREIETYLGIT